MSTMRSAMLLTLSALLAQLPLAAIAALGLLAAPAGASAQVKAVQPYHVVAIRDTEIRCGDSDALYAVASVKANQVLRVDGEVAGFFRVEYLPGMVAFVKAEEVSIDNAARVAVLNAPSRLLAASVLRREGAHYWPLLDNALPGGTRLPLIESLRSADGKVYGHLVSAPAGSRGFVRQLAVRRATPAESAAADAAARPGATPGQPAPQQPAPTPPAQPTPQPTTPTDTPAQPSEQPPVPVGDAAAPQPAPIEPAPQPVQPVEIPKPLTNLERLAELFDGVMAPGKSGEEIDAVIAEFNRSIRAATDDSVKRGLERRLDALKLKKEVVDAAARLRSRGDDFSERERIVLDAVANAQRQAVYTIVGRILPSTVYDGNRGMPLMFRIEAADAASSRTIGYVVPRPGIDLLAKSGRVVGIVGESRFDEALRLNIVAARRVDVLNPSGVFEPDRPAPAPAPRPAPAQPDDDQSDSVTIDEIMDGK